MLQTDIVNEIHFSINCIWKQHWSFSLKKKNLYIALIYPKQWIIAYIWVYNNIPKAMDELDSLISL